MSDQSANEEPSKGSLLCTSSVDPIDVRGARILCAAAVPTSLHNVFATDAPELIYPPDVRVTLDAPPRGVGTARYTGMDAQSLPEERGFVIVLVNGHGLCLFALPTLEAVRGQLAENLLKQSKAAHTFSVDSLGSDVVSESFRVAIAREDCVILLDVNPCRESVTILGQHAVDERLATVAFSEMTIVASTVRQHYMLRISRGGGLAVAAIVPRHERSRRSVASVSVNNSGAVVMSFFGNLFSKKDLSSNVPPVLAHALPDNRWLLTVDDELITYSSFGAKLDEMENVFKSKVGMDTSDVGSADPSASFDERVRDQRSGIVRSGSVSSIGSVQTGMSHLTYKDQSGAPRAEKPPSIAVFSSPFVLSVASDNELVAFAANGSLPGVIDRISLAQDESPSLSSQKARVKIIASRRDRTIATAFWPNGTIISINLCDDLKTLTEQFEAKNQLRLALALVPADQTDRLISLRRKLAGEARAANWHDAAIHHMQVVVNLSVRTDGVDQVDLVSEAVELRGPKGSSWHDDLVTATLWADFLFRLRRRIMRPSQADVDVLETLCYADESAVRVKALFSVKHDISLNAGELLITSRECVMREEERVEALVSLYTSLSEHGKALLLLENTELSNSFDGVIGYLLNSMRASDDIDSFFSHLKWVAHRATSEAQGRTKLNQLVQNTILNGDDLETIMSRLMEVLVEEADDLALEIIEEVTPTLAEDSNNKKDKGKGAGKKEKPELKVSADEAVAGMLAGMAKANTLQKRPVFEELRTLFNERILHNTDASYQTYTLLQALQSPRYKALGLHEEQAYLFGQQGRHEAAADELAAEKSLPADVALTRLIRMLPAADKPGAPESLVSAYLRVSAQGRALRVRDAAELVRCAGGTIEIDKVIQESRCGDDTLTLSDMWPLLKEALISGNDRLRIAECLRALRKNEVARMREEVLMRRRRFVVVGHDRACTLCTRRIGDSVFAAYPDGSIAHLACHMSRDGR